MMLFPAFLPASRSTVSVLLLWMAVCGVPGSVLAQETAASDSAGGAAPSDRPPEQVLMQARTALENGNYGDALTRAQALIERDTLSLQAQTTGAYVVMGRALANTGRRDSAIVAFDRAIATDPYFAGAYRYRASVLIEQGRYEEAVRDTREAVRLAPSNVDVLLQHAGVLYQLGRYEEAATTYGRVLNVQPANTEALLFRARSHLQRGNYRRAYFDAEDLIKQDPQQPEPYRIKAEALYATKRYTQAVDAYSDLIGLLEKLGAPASPRAVAYNNRSRAHLGAGNYEAAVEDATRALKLDDTLVSAYRNRGMAYGEMNQREPACSDFRTALRNGYTAEHGAEVKDVYASYCKGS